MTQSYSSGDHSRARSFVQYAQAFAAGGANGAFDFAVSHFGRGSQPAIWAEKSITSSTSLVGDSDYRAASRGFLELVRHRSLIGLIAQASSFARIPPRTPVLAQTGTITAQWVAEGGMIAADGFSAERVELAPLKVGAICVLTQELVRGAGRDFEPAISRELVRSIADAESFALLDPDAAGVADTAPASLLHGVDPLSSAGDIADDLDLLVAMFEGDLERAVLISRPETGVALCRAGFDAAGARGGEAAGLPLVTSSALPASVHMALVDPSGILLVDEGVVLDHSTQTSLQTGVDSDGQPIMLSLWQQNLVALLATRTLNWRAVRPSVAWMEVAS